MEWFPLIPASVAILYTRKALLCKDAKLLICTCRSYRSCSSTSYSLHWTLRFLDQSYVRPLKTRHKTRHVKIVSLFNRVIYSRRIVFFHLVLCHLRVAGLKCLCRTAFRRGHMIFTTHKRHSTKR
jgi:hypothetical protein